MLLAWMFVLHFVADFIFQSREMGQKKSSEWTWLAKHLMIQHAVFLVFLAPFVGIKLALIFATVNALIHGLIDWNIWRLYKLSAHIRIKKDIAVLDKIMVKDPMIDHEGLMEEAYQDKVKNWKYWEDHLFYTTIGFDQLLHGLTLILLFGLFL